MAYNTVLPDAFPFMRTVDHDLGRKLVNVLMDFDEDYTPNGSSFAVTSNAYPDEESKGRWHLWLSNVSYRRLVRLELIEGVEMDDLSGWE